MMVSIALSSCFCEPTLIYIFPRVNCYYARRLVSRVHHIVATDVLLTIAIARFRYHVPAPSAGHFPTADSTLINGLGRYSDGPLSPLAVVNVTQGARYRFRVVSIHCDSDYIFSIDGHPFVRFISFHLIHRLLTSSTMQTIIEVDGVNVEPLIVDSIHIFVGQRYSIVLEANQTVDNYWIRAQPVDTEVVDGINMAILRYSGAPPTSPNPTSNLTNPMLETNLRPLYNSGAPGNPRPGDVDIALNLEMAFDATNFTYTINGATFVPPSVPVLLQILSGARSAHDLLPPGSVYTLPRNKVVEISIPGGANDSPVRNISSAGRPLVKVTDECIASFPFAWGMLYRLTV